MTLDELLASIGQAEGVSVTQMIDRSALSCSRAAMRRHLQQLVKQGRLSRRSRGGVVGGRVLYWRTKDSQGKIA